MAEEALRRVPRSARQIQRAAGSRTAAPVGSVSSSPRVRDCASGIEQGSRRGGGTCDEAYDVSAVSKLAHKHELIDAAHGLRPDHVARCEARIWALELRIRFPCGRRCDRSTSGAQSSSTYQ